MTAIIKKEIDPNSSRWTTTRTKSTTASNENSQPESISNTSAQLSIIANTMTTTRIPSRVTLKVNPNETAMTPTGTLEDGESKTESATNIVTPTSVKENSTISPIISRLSSPIVPENSTLSESTSKTTLSAGTLITTIPTFQTSNFRSLNNSQVSSIATPKVTQGISTNDESATVSNFGLCNL